jgi:hypothetical protein
MSEPLSLNPYDGLTYAELCGRRKDYARLKDTTVAIRKEAERHLDLIGKAFDNTRPRRGIEASDHAVLRYLERVKGFDIEAIRAEIQTEVQHGQQVASELHPSAHRIAHAAKVEAFAELLAEGKGVA